MAQKGKINKIGSQEYESRMLQKYNSIRRSVHPEESGIRNIIANEL